MSDDALRRIPPRAGRAAVLPREGFTLIELLVVLGIVMVLLSILLPTMASVRRSGRQVKCLSNLHQVGIAFYLYAGESGGVLPDPGTAQTSWESLLMPRMTDAHLFECPSDDEIYPAVASSYDWHDTGDPTTTLAGQKLSTAPPDCVLAFDALPSWHGKHKMNAILVDGSGHLMSDDECLSDLGRVLRVLNTDATTKANKK